MFEHWKLSNHVDLEAGYLSKGVRLARFDGLRLSHCHFEITSILSAVGLV